MAGTGRTGFTDAALVRRLAPWIGPATDAPVGFLDQLSAWLRWTDAQPLFAALQEPIATPPWQPHFQQELDGLLQAELDLRWQPIAGLLAALPAPGPSDPLS